MQKGEDVIAAKQSSLDYSPVFNLVLKPSENRTLEDGKFLTIKRKKKSALYFTSTLLI